MTILSESRTDDATLSMGSWSVALNNLKTSELTSVARSTDLTLANTQMRIALTSTASMQFIVVGPGNFSATCKIKVRAASNVGFTTIVYDSGWVNAMSAGFAVDTERGAPIVFRLSPAVNARYWHIELDDTGNPAGYIELARLFMPRVYTPAINYGFDSGGLSFLPKTQSVPTLPGGRIDRYRPPLRSFAVTLSEMPETEAYGDVYRLAAKIAFGRQVFVIPDPDDTAWIEKRAFFGTIQEVSPIAQPAMLRAATGFRIEESLCAPVYAGWP